MTKEQETLEVLKDLYLQFRANMEMCLALEIDVDEEDARALHRAEAHLIKLGAA